MIKEIVSSPNHVEAQIWLFWTSSNIWVLLNWFDEPFSCPVLISPSVVEGIFIPFWSISPQSELFEGEPNFGVLNKWRGTLFPRGPMVTIKASPRPFLTWSTPHRISLSTEESQALLAIIKSQNQWPTVYGISCAHTWQLSSLFIIYLALQELTTTTVCHRALLKAHIFGVQGNNLLHTSHPFNIKSGPPSPHRIVGSNDLD